MGSRVNDFMAFEENKRKDIANIIEFEGVTVFLYRRSSSEGDGFTNEVSGLTFKMKFGAEIIEEDGLTATNITSLNKSIYTLRCNYRNIQKHDICRINDTDYKVVSINKSPKNEIQILIERLEDI